MKQTAIEFLLDNLIICGVFDLDKSQIDIIKQAKEMEKQQIIEAVDVCVSTVEVSEDGLQIIALSGESFYKEAYILKTI